MTTTGQTFVAQPMAKQHLAVEEADFHEESSASASASSFEREQDSMTSSASSSSSAIVSTRLPDNWQTPVSSVVRGARTNYQFCLQEYHHINQNVYPRLPTIFLMSFTRYETRDRLQISVELDLNACF